MPACPHRAHRPAARLLALRASEAGVAAVEFALVLPVLIIGLLGMTEVTYGVNLDRKLTILSRSLADLSSRVQAISTTEMGNIFSAASAVMQPYNAGTTQMVVSSVEVTASNNNTVYTGKVLWSCAKNIPARPTGAPANWGADNLRARDAGSAYTVPSGFRTPTTKSFILVETMQPYRPIFGQVLSGTINLREVTPWPVRNNDKVTGPTSCPA